MRKVIYLALFSLIGFSITNSLKAEDNFCLNLKIFNKSINLQDRKSQIEKTIEMFKQGKAVPFKLISADYNGDDKKELVLIGGLRSDAVCKLKPHNMVFLFSSIYDLLTTSDKKENINNIETAISELKLFSHFSDLFTNAACKTVNCVDENDLCNNKKYFYYFAMDVTNSKILWLYPLNLNGVISFQSGPIFINEGQNKYIGFTYIKKNVTQYELHFVVIPLKSNIENIDIWDIVLKSDSNILKVGKLYNNALDWDFDGIDDVAFIPYYVNTGDNNWRSHIIALNVKDDISNWQLEGDKRDFDTSSIIKTEVVPAFWYGKPYLFFGANRNKLNGNLEEIKPTDFFAVSLCGNQNCDFNTFTINPNDYVKDIDIDFKNKVYTSLSENECENFIEQHRGLHFKWDKNYSCINSANLYQTIYDNGIIKFLSENPTNGKFCGFNLKVDSLIRNKNGVFLVGNNYIYGTINVNSNLDVKFKEGNSQISIKPHELVFEGSFKNTPVSTSLESNTASFGMSMGQGYISMHMSTHGGGSISMSMSSSNNESELSIKLKPRNEIKGTVKFSIRGPHPVLSQNTNPSINPIESLISQPAATGKKGKIMFWLKY